MESNDLEARVTALETRVRQLDGRVRASEHDAAAARVLAGAAGRDVEEMRGRFDTAAAGQQQIVNLIQTVIDNQSGGTGRA